jgi:hypothetical protein
VAGGRAKATVTWVTQEATYSLNYHTILRLKDESIEYKLALILACANIIALIPRPFA